MITRIQHVLKGVHHIAIICSDYTASKYFYTQILGLKILQETFREERQSYKLDLLLPDRTQIELFSFVNPPARPSYPEATGLRHLAFKVDQLEPIIKHLHSYNIDCEAIRIDSLTGKRFTFFHDPDHLPLEIYED